MINIKKSFLNYITHFDRNESVDVWRKAKDYVMALKIAKFLVDSDANINKLNKKERHQDFLGIQLNHSILAKGQLGIW